MKQAFQVCAEICHYKNKINEQATTKKQIYEWGKHVTQLEKELRQYCIFKKLNYNVVWEKFKQQATKRKDKNARRIQANAGTNQRS